jgi:cytoskeletal protein CcmA (bactofilin family)
MFSKKDSTFKDYVVDTIIGSNSIFIGNIESEGAVRIDGKLKGSINSQGDVYIGSNALITGNITADNIHLAGIVEGNIISKGMLKVLSTAKLYGDIKVNSLIADEGALFQGKCSMIDNSTKSDSSAEKSSS